MKKLLTLLFSTITIFALVSCNDVDTSSTTSVITSSSSNTSTSSYIDTSSLETSSLTSEDEIVSESSSSSESESVYYHVRFVNDDDSLLYEVDVLEGESATYVGETPTKEGTDTVTYTFKGWDKDYSSVTSDLTVTATYYAVEKDGDSGWGSIRWPD